MPLNQLVLDSRRDKHAQLELDGLHLLLVFFKNRLGVVRLQGFLTLDVDALLLLGELFRHDLAINWVRAELGYDTLMDKLSVLLQLCGILRHSEH